MSIFKNREVRIKLVNPKKDNDTTPTTMEEHINNATAGLDKEIAMDMLKRTAITIGLVVVGLKVVDVLCEIAIKRTPSADNE